VAFECRCIRPGFVTLPHRTRQYASVARLAGCGASTLSVLYRFYELKPLAFQAPLPNPENVSEKELPTVAGHLMTSRRDRRLSSNGRTAGEGMEMTRKSALYALAVVVLTGSMAVAALADDHGMNMYGPADSSVSAQPEQGVEQSDAWDLREAMETGALPGQPVGSSDGVCCGGIDEPTIESGGQLFRPDVDAGP
jgi:hypothetical protein